MIRLLLKTLPGTLLAGVMLVSASAWSMGPHDGPRMGPPDPDAMMERMTKDLNLTDEQSAKITELMNSGRAEGKADRKRMHEIYESLRSMRSAFDEAEARKLTDELGQISSRMAYRMASHGAQVYAVLTPEQRTQLDAKMEKMQARMEQRGERRGDMKDTGNSD